MTNYIETAIQNLVDEDYADALESLRAVRSMQDRVDHTQEIFAAACPTLGSLCRALNGLEDALEAEEERPSSWGKPELPLDITSLPLYGDDDADLGWDGVYSWDERRQLVCGNDGWQIERRWDLDEEDDD